MVFLVLLIRTIFLFLFFTIHNLLWVQASCSKVLPYYQYTWLFFLPELWYHFLVVIFITLLVLFNLWSLCIHFWAYLDLLVIWLIPYPFHLFIFLVFELIKFDHHNFLCIAQFLDEDFVYHFSNFISIFELLLFWHYICALMLVL